MRTGHLRRLTLTLSSACLLAAPVGVGMGAAPAASAVSTHTWTGTVTKVVDGDTADIDIDGDDRGPVPVRNASIQAMEVGECHAAEATARHRQLVLGKRVRLTAENPDATSLGRPVRYVDVRNADGSYTDVQLTLLREGHALWLNNLAGEDARSPAYHLAAEQAAAAGRNLWDRDLCGAGPQQSVPVKLWVNYEADGVDTQNLNGEYVRILNQGTTALSVGGWWVRDASHLAPYRFPAGTTIPAGRYITLRTGKGTRTAATFYWGQSVPLFGNLDAPGSVGDSAYLYDPQGDVRAHAMYRCLYRCTDPVKGKVYISSVHWDADGDDTKNYRDEYIALRSTTTVDLSYRVLETNGNVRELGRGSILRPGEVMRVHAGTGPPGRLTKWWGHDGPLLPNSGGKVTLRTTEGTTLDSYTWSGRS